MQVSVSTIVHAPKETVWRVVTDFAHAAETISAIDQIEVLEQPEGSLVGFRWRETRTMFGKQATEVMTITDVEVGTAYTTRAESHGAVYISRLSLEANGTDTTVTQTFEATAVTFRARVMNLLLCWLMRSGVKKAFAQDLADIKRAAEAN